MKQLLCVLMLLPCFSMAQLRHPKTPNPANAANHKEYYQKALTLTTYHHADSSYNATCMLLDLFKYDTTLYSFNTLLPLLDTIAQSNYRYLRDSIQGTWLFLWSGTNRDTAHTSETLQKHIQIQKDTAVFYTSGVIQRKTTFSIRQTWPEKHFLSINHFDIVFDDNQEKWALQLTHNPIYNASIRKPLPVTVTFNQMPGCSCGCPEEIYGRSWE